MKAATEVRRKHLCGLIVYKNDDSALYQFFAKLAKLFAIYINQLAQIRQAFERCLCNWVCVGAAAAPGAIFSHIREN
jgi:hypothetical protein